uniref:Uncharacterized protein n=1 Tax=Crocodylus porosus TaxID=8502 RepID=A0A7M4E0U4_CROPO
PTSGPGLLWCWHALQAAATFHPGVFVLKNYGENPESYNEELKKLELLRQVSMWLAFCGVK